MLSVSNNPDVLNIYIDLRFVIAVKQFFLKLLKRTIVIHDRCSPNGSTFEEDNHNSFSNFGVTRQTTDKDK
jgi:hypothetical protein